MPGVSAAFAALLSSPPGDDPARIAAISESLLPAENAALLPSPLREVFFRRALEKAEAAICAVAATAFSARPDLRLVARDLSRGAVETTKAQRARAFESLIALDRREGHPAEDCAVSPRLEEAAAALCCAAVTAAILTREDRPDEAAVVHAMTAAHSAAARAIAATADEVARAASALAFRFGFEEICGESLGVALEQGRALEFLLGFSACAGLDPATARRTLEDPSVEALAVASAAAGLSRGAFARIAFTLHADDAAKIRAVEALDRYRDIPPDGARAVADAWAKARARTPHARADGFAGADMAMAAG